MSWICELTQNSKEDLEALPKGIQKRIARTLAQLSVDPFRGDVKALQGPEWRGVFRRRLGDYRLLFTVDRAKQVVTIHQISKRSGNTYR